MVEAGPGGTVWAGGGLAWWARQLACRQASEQNRRRPEAAKGESHQAQETITLS